jgi:hypothetical protein
VPADVEAAVAVTGPGGRGLSHYNVSISTSEQMIAHKFRGRLGHGAIIEEMTAAVGVARAAGAQTIGVNAEDGSRTDAVSEGHERHQAGAGDEVQVVESRARFREGMQQSHLEGVLSALMTVASQLPSSQLRGHFFIKTLTNSGISPVDPGSGCLRAGTAGRTGNAGLAAGTGTVGQTFTQTIAAFNTMTTFTV